jgi:4-hydroxy-3-polyprenylbenzoate decarboxylase
MIKRKIVVAVTGASGSLYAKLMFDKLKTLEKQVDEVGVVFSSNALDIWKYELGSEFTESRLFRIYSKNNFYAPFASGSCDYDAMIVCPCSMGVLGRIANGVSDDLISRAADVMLKERRKLVLVLRETPYSLIHIENMKTVTLSGGIICPASPSFYSRPKTIEELAETVVDRVLTLAGFETDGFRWGDNV